MWCIDCGLGGCWLDYWFLVLVVTFASSVGWLGLGFQFVVLIVLRFTMSFGIWFLFGGACVGCVGLWCIFSGNVIVLVF